LRNVLRFSDPACRACLAVRTSPAAVENRESKMLHGISRIKRHDATNKQTVSAVSDQGHARTKCNIGRRAAGLLDLCSLKEVRMPTYIAPNRLQDRAKFLGNQAVNAGLQAFTQILNGRFDRLSASQVVDEIIKAAHAGERGALCTVNVAILMMMRSNARLQKFVEASRWTVADGQPLVWASRLTKQALPERVTGVDLIDLLCARSAQERLGVYFLGAEGKTVRAAAEALRSLYPGLDVRGFSDGYFGPELARARARAVAESGAAILFVAMGVPRQEYFIEEQWEHFGARVVIGVGGSFDVIAGLRKRAPPYIQRVGLEWAYRLVQEPRRLFKRYLVTNSQFIGLMARASITHLFHSRRAIPRT
jgi:N-acetylglucosaminyldiphosphoundecaprenol N-acetyl-beta-D-mannosaminyltransferase